MIGKTISHYKIDQELGRGGMGVVYKAEDTKLKRNVALKFLPQDLTRDPEANARFILEAQAASALDHQNICTIHEINETKKEQTYIVMAFYEGQTLKQLIQDRPLKIDESIRIIIQIAEGLLKAHRKGIIHRDIKPANIIIDEDGTVKILDFGLAKLTGQMVETKTGTTMGTIKYMSPEQTSGDPVDQRSDIWSLGVLFYEMLTGQVPFKGDYEQAIIYSIMNEEPQSPSSISSGIPPELELIIHKALTKDPDDRYQDIGQLNDDLQILDDESSEIVSGKVTIKKRWTNITLAVSVLLMVLIVIEYFLKPIGDFGRSETGNTEWENSIAVLPFADLSPNKDQEWFCDGMTEQIITNLSKIERLKVIARTSVMTYKNINKQIPEIGKELNVTHILEGSIRKYGKTIRVTAQLINTIDGSHLWADVFDRELEHVFEVQDDVSQAIAINLLANLSLEEKKEIKSNRPDNTEAYEYYMKGKYFALTKFYTSLNEVHFKTSEQLFKKSIYFDPKFAEAYAGLAELYTVHWDLIDQETTRDPVYIKLAAAYIDSALKLNSKSADTHAVRAYMFLFSSQMDSAYKSIKNALRNNRYHGDANAYLGLLYENLGLSNLSIKYLTKAIEINPLDTWQYILRAKSYETIKEYHLTEIDFQKALQIEPNHNAALSRFAFFLIRLNKYENAKTMIDKFTGLYPDSYQTYLIRLLLSIISGDKKRVLDLADAPVDNWKHSRLKYIAYLYLGMKEEATVHLIKYSEVVHMFKHSSYISLENHLLFDPIRSDPRFQELLVKHKELYEDNLKKYGDIDI